MQSTGSSFTRANAQKVFEKCAVCTTVHARTSKARNRALYGARTAFSRRRRVTHTGQTIPTGVRRRRSAAWALFRGHAIPSSTPPYDLRRSALKSRSERALPLSHLRRSRRRPTPTSAPWSRSRRRVRRRRTPRKRCAFPGFLPEWAAAAQHRPDERREGNIKGGWVRGRQGAGLEGGSAEAGETAGRAVYRCCCCRGEVAAAFVSAVPVRPPPPTTTTTIAAVPPMWRVGGRRKYPPPESGSIRGLTDELVQRDGTEPVKAGPHDPPQNVGGCGADRVRG